MPWRILLVLVAALFVFGCDNNDSMEDVGEDVDEAIDDVGDEVEDALDD